MRNKIFILFSLTPILFARCAKIGTITGGLKDTIPPVLISSKPEQQAINNKEKSIVLTFNEFLDLKNIQQELMVSPPLPEKPVVKLKGKSIDIDLNNELKDSTTYTLNFGSSITDYTEGNILANFEYVFSTGSFIDSFSVRGTLKDAYEVKPPKDPVLVMLYASLSDSAPYKEIPLYAAKTNKEGQFAINNLRADTFRIFALADANNNMRFDIPEEKIAFSDSLIYLFPEMFLNADSNGHSGFLQPDTIFPASLHDTISNDSLAFKKEYFVKVNLSLFQQAPAKQYLKDNKRPLQQNLFFCFNLPVNDSIHFEPVDSLPFLSWYLAEINSTRDSVSLWITDSSLYKKDGIKLRLTYPETDSTGNIVSVTDTIDFRFTPPETGKRKKEDKPARITSKLNSNISSSQNHDLNVPVILESIYPIQNIFKDSIHLTKLEDTLWIPVPFVFSTDSVNPRKFILSVPWQEGTRYKLFIPPSAFTNLYQIPFDTLDVSFTTQKSEYYGKLMISVDNATSPVIVLVLEKEKLIRQGIVQPGKKLLFDYMHPRMYQFKAIIDTNKNGKWDTGNYLNHVQPEKVINYPKEEQVRSNWDLDVTISLKSE